MFKKVILFSLFLFMMIFPMSVFALNEVNVYFFYSPTCNICSQEKAFLEALQQNKYPNLRIYYYDTSEDKNLALMNQAKELYQETTNGVPFTIIGDSAFAGFSQGRKCSIQKAIYQYSYHAYENKFGTTISGTSYRTDLEGDVEEYDGEEDYMIEENPGGTITENQTTEEKESLFDNSKFRSSMILVLCGVILGIIVLFLTFFERRNRH